LTTVILPKRNEKDLDDLPPEVREELRFALVERIDEALDVAFGTEAMAMAFSKPWLGGESSQAQRPKGGSLS
jgi:ATP-dependent Lon protease